MRFEGLLTVFYMLTVSLGAIVGIDLGEKFTKSVILAPGASYEILLTEEARRKDLTGLSIRSSSKDDLERVFGSAANSLCIRFPQNCITGIKSILGKSIDDLETTEYLKNHYGVKLLENDDNGGIKIDLGLANQSYQFSVEEILAMNLKDIKQRAVKALHENPHAQAIADDVTVSINGFASQAQRQSYLNALELAEYSNILGLVDDGTSVAINFLTKLNFDQKDFNDVKKYYMVYDMGAGSTKATLFSITAFSNMTKVLELQNIGYDSTFGGDFLTQSIYTLIFEKLSSQFKFDESKELNARTNARLLEAAEKAKTILSANSDYRVSLESVIDDEDFKTTISRQEFEDINSDNMARITKPILDALKESELSVEDLESVVLTGGSSRVPFVQRHLVSLLTEDKISKTVNADESCAIGTTVKGFKLKNKLSNSINKDFEIIEKNYHNLEIIVNEEESSIFPKFSTIDQTKKVSLGELVDDLNIEMYEDGKLIKSYKVDGILDKTKSLTCNNDKSYTKEIFASFEVDSNKLFNLKKLEAECVKKSGFFKNLLKKDEVEEEEIEVDEDESVEAKNSTTKEKKSIKVLRPVQISLSRPIYPSVKPMSKPLKQRLVSKLNYLDSRDELKIKLDNIKNKLESECYSLRNYIQDNELEIDTEPIESMVSEFIEWLDFESDDATMEDFEEKLSIIKSKRDEIDKHNKIQETDLSKEGLQKLYEDGSNMIMKIQNRMLDFGSEISAIRQKYVAENFDFDKENDRAKAKLMNRGDDKLLTLDKTLDSYKQKLTDLSTILESKTFDSIPKIDLLERFESISDSIVDMLADLLIVEQSHKGRLSIFENKLQKLISRRQKEEEKQKLKDKKAAEAEVEAEADAEEQVDAEVETNESVEEPQEIDHDEL
ncbi:heat shock protein 70 homolog Lhs1p [[Candida] jaroonii]|uniref:Heat shock protein 70 homolog Lhs1p n=1 Tax=[Candida] jaroonii TaxID=467808 RepID=A0ACA9YAR7_9ASCO|nr:heat shock protein 70 homolog Lhs1p [[Candida] jaroonii]